MKDFDRALLIGGAATSLLAGVAAAELGLAPIHNALTRTAPSLDTMAADSPGPIQADLQSASAAYPPPVLVPVSAPTPPRPPRDATARPASGAGDDGDERADDERGPSLELGAAPQELARADTDGDQDRDPPVSIVTSPGEDVAPPSAE